MSDTPIATLAALDGVTGFQLAGEADLHFAGSAVSAAGDVNGDGFDDVLVGAYGATGTGDAITGSAYVVFGRASGFAASMGLGTLDGVTGFKIAGSDTGGALGISVGGGGDFNGDGFDDLLVANNPFGPFATSGTSAYLIFGKATGFAAMVAAAGSGPGMPLPLRGITAPDLVPPAVAFAGDVNRDGLADLLVGIGGDTPSDTPGSAGIGFVVSGTQTMPATEIQLPDVGTVSGGGAASGFEFHGGSSNILAGAAVSGAGDINGDGFDDVLVGAYRGPSSIERNGVAYVVFGSTTPATASLRLSDLDGTHGFRLVGVNADDYAGYSVSGAGDVNGDGFDDLLIGAYGADLNGNESGAAYLVFGKAGGFPASIALAALSGADGFRMVGAQAGDLAGIAVSGAGDFNGDGYADIAIGAEGAGPVGSASGAVYVVFGKAGTFAASLNLSSLDGSSGIIITGASPGDRAGQAVAGAGDINGDGFDDLVIGSYQSDAGGQDSGASHVVFGGNFTGAVTHAGTAIAEALNGSPGDDAMVAGLGNDTLQGGEGRDTLRGGGGNDLLRGGPGADSLVGGGGQDTADYSTSIGAVHLNLATRSYSGGDASGDHLVDVENLIGSAGNDMLTGDWRGNFLSGGAGADTMAGGDGNDVYYVDESGDVVIETNALPAGGTDTVVSTVTYSAGSHIENIIFTGAAGTTGIGNSLANYIEGNAAQNYLFGGAGTDTMKGNDGNDIYYVDASTDVVIETNALAAGGTDTVVSSVTYQLGANLEQLLLSGNAAITGIGNATANYIEGNSAQNYLSGGAGSDTLKGNDGNDVYYVDVSTDVVIETNADTVSGGVDFVVSTVTYQLGANVENLLLSGTDPITGIGSAVNNYIEGNDAANFLSGGLGADTMKGNDGNDVYYVDNTGDVVIETNAVQNTGGRDTVSSSIAYALGANVEDLLLTGNAAIGGLGNGLANYMTGNTAANALSGQDGNDTLIGGTGTDTLTGGLGADTFDFNTLLDSLVGASRDIITDFSSAQGDKVDLAGIDANTLLANDQAFSFIGAAAFSLVAGQLRFAGNILAGDTDGNGIADFEIQLIGVASLVAADFLL